MIRIGCVAIGLLVALAAPAGAQPFNKVLKIGDAAPAWEGLEGTDGKRHALADFKGQNVVVVVFTCNSCPVAAGYEDRLIAFVKAHAAPDSKVAVVAINVNTAKEDALPAMKVRAQKKKLPYPYLFDPTQEVARKHGATFTPEVFVFDASRKLVYTGAMDDKAPPGVAKTPHLENAVKAALAGKPAVPAATSAAAGCRIKYNPKARE